MELILDGSFALSWCVEDESNPIADSGIEVMTVGYVPAIWPFEVLNALIMAGRRNRIDPRLIEQHLKDLNELPIRIESAASATEQSAIFRLATKHKLTAYDAAYLELAVRKSLPLATLDKNLHKAAKAELVAFESQ